MLDLVLPIFSSVAFALALPVLAPSALAQCESTKLTASDGDAGDRFGYGARIDGDRLLIPAKHDEAPASDSGSAYIFDFDGANWVESAKLIAASGASGDLMGWESILQGDEVFLGTPIGDGVVLDSGTVVIFDYDGVTWSEAQTLSVLSGADGDFFGRSLAVDGDFALIGAPRTDGIGANSGSAFVFERIAGVWTQVQELLASDATSGDQFGWALDLDGDTAVIGAWGQDAGGTDSGAVYVFERSGGSFAEVQKLTPSDAPSGQFGWTVRVDGDWVVVGAALDDEAGFQGGAAYVFGHSGASWVEHQKLIPVDAAIGDKFGTTIELDGARFLGGAATADHGGNGAGTVYVYQLEGALWRRRARLTASDAEAGDRFSRYMDLDGNRALIGAIHEDDNGADAGAAYIFELDTGITPYCFCPNPAVCSNDDAFAGCETSTGEGAFLWACGSSSVSADDLSLHVDQLPTGQFGLIYMGAGSISLPFGDGQRCVGAGGVGLYRFPIRSSGTGGSLVEGPGLVAYSIGAFNAAGQLSVGQSWSFQYWFRDPGGPCGTAFNLSNA
ncbi:MAG: hypothetical protein ACI841_004326, partial [Planctomycetota bacterium]